VVVLVADTSVLTPVLVVREYPGLVTTVAGKIPCPLVVVVVVVRLALRHPVHQWPVLVVRGQRTASRIRA
jgi:hypothetical protein